MAYNDGSGTMGPFVDLASYPDMTGYVTGTAPVVARTHDAEVAWGSDKGEYRKGYRDGYTDGRTDGQISGMFFGLLVGAGGAIWLRSKLPI